jgi:hypothetical protein
VNRPPKIDNYVNSSQTLNAKGDANQKSSVRYASLSNQPSTTTLRNDYNTISTSTAYCKLRK